MKQRIKIERLVVLQLFLMLFTTAVTAEPLSLADCYQLALKQSEDLQLQDAALEAAESRYRQAIASMFPRFDGSVSQQLRNNKTGVTSIGGNTASPQGTGRHNLQTAVKVTQPIFSGFREFIAADSMKTEMEGIHYQKERKAQLLYFDVAQAYYQIALYQQDLRELAKTEQALNDRIRELVDWVKLGRSRDSEEVAARAEASEQLATKEKTIELLQVSQELLSFLTGRPSSDLQIADSGPLGTADSLEHYLERTRKRSDIVGQELHRRAQEKQVTVIERQHWPAIYAEGDVYPYDDPNSDREWDVLLKLQLPIFESGRIESQADEQRAQVRASEITEQQLKRSSEKEVRTAYTSLVAIDARIAQLEKVVEDSRRNYISQKKDYTLGLVTNLDVLAAIQREQNARRELILAQSEHRIGLANLRVAAGEVAP